MEMLYKNKMVMRSTTGPYDSSVWKSQRGASDPCAPSLANAVNYVELFLAERRRSQNSV